MCHCDQTVWDYPGMQACAKELDRLRDRSNSNKSVMDKAFETLVAGMDADVGKAFLAAYSKNVSSIDLFAQVLDSEARQLRGNITTMQNADAEIAAQIRKMFGV